MTGKHTGIADFYQDLPSPPRREYLDYYNFNSFASLGIYDFFDYLFRGPGPLMYRSNSNLVLGDTFAQDARAVLTSATMYAEREDFTAFRTVTLSALESGRPVEICGEDNQNFEVRVRFRMPNSATAVSGSRTIVRVTGEPPSINAFRVISWRFENVNLSSVPKTGEIVMILYCRGRSPEITLDSIYIEVAGDIGSVGFRGNGTVRIVCE